MTKGGMVKDLTKAERRLLARKFGSAVKMIKRKLMDKLNTNVYATLMVGALLTYSGGREFESLLSHFLFNSAVAHKKG